MKLRLAAAIGLLSLVATCAAQKTINVPSDQPTIQAGINAANTGDTVLVAPGTYQENVAITGKIITLAAAACTAPGATATCNQQTTIDGQKLGSVVTVSSSNLSLKTTVSGFTLINGTSGSSGSSAGVEIDNNSGATVTNNVFSANAAAVTTSNSALTFSGNTVTDVIQNGTSCGSANGLILTGTNTVVLDNSGAVAVTTINGNTFSGGKCTGGVGINDQQGTNIYIGFNQITGQSLAISVAATNAQTYIYNNVIYGNTTGGVSINHLGASPSADPADTFLINNTFVNNLSSAKGLSGSVGPAEVAITGSFSKVALINNIFSTNSTTNPILDCAGAASSTSNQITPIILDHNLFYNSGSAGKLGADGCPVISGTFGNINVNPGFVSTTNFALTSSSPAIDTGNNSYGTIFPFISDIAGNNRILKGTPNLNGLVTGPVVDMGAYEFNASTPSSSIYTLAATSSSYYLTAGNNFTVSANLASGANVLNTTPLAGQPVTFTGTGTATLPPVTVTTDANGNASVPYIVATPGLYAFTVSDSNSVSVVLYVYVTNPLAVTTVGLASSANPSLAGQSVTFTITSNATDGTHPSPIILSDSGVQLASLVTTSGTATYKTSTLATGSHPLTATYAGDTAHTSGLASLLQNVGNYTPTTTTLTSTPSPSIFSQNVTLSAHISATAGTPTGTVQFSDGGTNIGGLFTVDASGNASYSTTTFAVGTHNLTATYTATGAFASSAGTATQVVNAIPTKSVLTSSATTATAGTAITFTAQVSVPAPYTGPPTGTVTFFDGATTLGTTALTATSVASYTSAALSVGTHNITCTFNGAGTFASSNCNTIAIIITAAPTNLTVATSLSPSPALTSVTFTTHLTSSGQSAGAGNAITLAITPSNGTPFSTSLTTDSTGTATYTTATLTPGQYTVTATYTATTSLLGSTASTSQVITANQTTVTLIAAPSPGLQNNPVTLAATVAATTGGSAPAGSVNFLDGQTIIATMPLSAIGGTTSGASYIATFQIAGTHNLTAVYVPSSTSFTGSVSAPVALTINPQDFTISANSTAISIQTLHKGSLSITLTSIGGFSSYFSVSCGSPVPPYLSCELPQQQPSLNNSTTTTTFPLTLDTSSLVNYYGMSNGAPHIEKLGRIALATLLPLVLLGTARRRKHLRRAMMLVCLAVVTAALSACSGMIPNHTPPGTYTIPITATGIASGSSTPTTHTLNITLTVTP